MNPNTPITNSTGFFINPNRVNNLTSSAPDTSSSVAVLKEVPFEQLRKGFPRNPLLNIQQAGNKLPTRLAQRLAALPAKGNPISTSKTATTAQFTSLNPIDLLGEDYEMDTATGTSGTHDIEITPEQIGIDGIAVATVLGVENTEMSIESLKGMIDSTQLTESEVINVCLQSTVEPNLKTVLQDLPGSDGLDQLADAMDRMAHASRLTNEVVDQLLTEPLDPRVNDVECHSSQHHAHLVIQSAMTPVTSGVSVCPRFLRFSRCRVFRVIVCTKKPRRCLSIRVHHHPSPTGQHAATSKQVPLLTTRHRWTSRMGGHWGWCRRSHDGANLGNCGKL